MRKKIILSIVGGLGLFGILVIAMLFWFGSFGATMAYLNGDAIYVYPRKIDLGNQEPGTETVAVFHLKNLTSKEISVVGEKSSCRCAFSEKLPITAPPGKTVELKVNIHLPKYESGYDQMISFMVAEPERLAMVPVQVTAKIPNSLPTPPPEKPQIEPENEIKIENNES